MAVGLGLCMREGVGAPGVGKVLQSRLQRRRCCHRRGHSDRRQQVRDGPLEERQHACRYRAKYTLREGVLEGEGGSTGASRQRERASKITGVQLPYEPFSVMLFSEHGHLTAESGEQRFTPRWRLPLPARLLEG